MRELCCCAISHIYAGPPARDSTTPDPFSAARLRRPKLYWLLRRADLDFPKRAQAGEMAPTHPPHSRLAPCRLRGPQLPPAIMAGLETCIAHSAQRCFLFLHPVLVREPVAREAPVTKATGPLATIHAGPAQHVIAADTKHSHMRLWLRHGIGKPQVGGNRRLHEHHCFFHCLNWLAPTTPPPGNCAARSTQTGAPPHRLS